MVRENAKETHPEKVGDAPPMPEAAFPTLTRAQLGRVRPLGKERVVAAGEGLFTEGEESYDFIVILEGSAAVYEDRAGERQIARDVGVNNFLGEMGLLLGETVYATAKMKEAGCILSLTPEALRELLGRDAELSNLILSAFAARRGIVSEGGSGLTIVGSRKDRDAVRLATFASRNYLPMRWLDLEDDVREAEAFLTQIGRTKASLEETGAIAVWGSETVLDNPSNFELARVIGFGSELASDEVVDLAIVGAGPGGLAAAVYGASEGLSTVVLDEVGAGGQAGSSSRIENYLGFPAGVSGTELASRAIVQARKFGAAFGMPHEAVSLGRNEDSYLLTLKDGGKVGARTVVIATGVYYRRLPLARLRDFEGVGVYYAATEMEARNCFSNTVAVVGGGNSAGQAAMFLSERAARVVLLIRGDDLRKSMSSYLADRVEASPRIDVMLHSEVRELHGEGGLEQVTIEHTDTGERETLQCPALFLFIGAVPRTEWVRSDCGDLTVATDAKGFIKTGLAVGDAERDASLWRGLTPSTFETSLPGVFAVGDVRSGSTKRVAGAVGEGSVAVKAVHDRLKMYK